MEQSLSLEANSSSASQEIPHILQNPQIHYYVHRYPPLGPILSLINPFHIPSPILFLEDQILSSICTYAFPVVCYFEFSLP